MGNKVLEGTAALMVDTAEIQKDIFMLNFRIVNAFFIGDPKNKYQDWVIVDSGLENSDGFIVEAAQTRFGEIPPKAIILTHGHFDHVGSVIALTQKWNIPVYIHRLELPYITGEKDYPMGDPSVGGDVSALSPTFPHSSIDLGNKARNLPVDGSVPGMRDWEWIHTPGHTQGHICLFRARDGVILTGDAITTVKQESMNSVLSQETDVNGPPAYLTEDFEAAKKSIQKIKELDPSLILPSHGQPIKGEELRKQLSGV